MEWYYIVLICLLVLLLSYFSICFVIAYHMMNIVINPYCLTYQETIEKLKKDNRLEKNYRDLYNLEEYYIDSLQGYKLKVAYINNNIEKEKIKKVIVLVHGWTASHLSMFAYANMYIKLGFHVFLYDHRNHMHSDKKVTTMGELESIDLQCIINHVKEKLGNNVIIGTHGESMGATTCMIHAGKYHSVSFVCEDCGFSSLKELLTYQCKYLKHFPVFPTIIFASLIFRLKTKCSFYNINTKQYLATCDDIPMMFIHGSKDSFVPAYMVYKNFDYKNGYKKVCIYDCKRHAFCIMNNYENYFNDLKEFLTHINIIE